MPDISKLFCQLLRNQTTPVLNNNLLFKSQVNKELWAFLFAKPFSTLSANTVDKVFCNGCEENCYMPVEQIRKNDDTVVNIISCDKKDNFGLVELDENDIKAHKFNMLVFCKSLGNALKSCDEATTLIPNLLYKIGRCFINDIGYTVFLATNIEDEQKIKSHVEYKNAFKPVIISINYIHKNTSLPFVYIDSLIYIDEKHNFGIFNDCITSLYQVENRNSNLFKKEGKKWFISFEGKTAWINETKGCSYITELLVNPNKEIKAIDLQATINKHEQPNEEYKDMSEDELEKEGMSVHVESPDNIIDKETLSLYKTNLKQIHNEIDEATNNGMTAKANNLQKQKEAIEDFIRKNTNIKGESRKVADRSERTRIAVRRAINTVYKNIENEIPELSLHLKAYITTGHTCIYKPDKNYEWQVK